MKRFIYSIFAIILIITATACNQKKKNDGSINTDRVVCVSKQLNEIIFAIGAGSHVVGADLTSVYPEEVKKLPKVGYHRALNAEGIISLEPTLVIHDGNIAPAAVMDQLSKVGIPVKEFPEAKSLEETIALTKQLGVLFHTEAKADSVCRKLENDLKTAEEKRKQYKDTVKVILVHFGQQSNQYLVVGQKSAASQMLEMAGGKNAISGAKPMGPLSAEAVAQAQPDVILATEVGFDQKGSAENFKTLPGIALTPAGKNNKIYRIEEGNIIYWGPRSGENIIKIMDIIHK